MADYNTIRAGAATGTRSAQIDEGLRTHMTKVYSTMSVGMLITALVSWAIAGLAVSDVPTAYQLSANTYLTSTGAAIYASPLKWLIMFAPLLFVFGFSAGINRMSAATAQTVFYAFAAVMGLSISSIFLVFTGASIVTTFLVTSIAFASLSLYGYTTKKDLSAMGTFLMMGLIGLIVASVINIFVASSALQFAISVIGVLIFAGLTAYDTQSIKNEYIQMAQSGDQEWLGKAAIMGALRLYLDFINMFMFLLQFLGNRE
ncbi:Bax inhibitor-1/YccA family protein [Meridianimarinicoccus aquatilis]|uniref:Bax inhibitor-1/YccA family protein n=1 Tax=Meridianimarinicoccus aquatilis TaxID=2552766 RepID=A0A4R6ATG5_9RHOB|nr:Bax inhibitor-1/YccA family protein [Fluviibacterium aquatile]QIE42458.1 Bax inhibitor-1/YccA family protein [Rhodobacteraceae bacterium SC52]TDL86965.1 Bax inhibitor-1/YccA family protein [Fluviibacterium aquatile]